jgi:hypothetical protein
MVISNNAKFDPIIELLLGGEGCEIKHVFLWGVEKRQQIEVPHLLNPKWPLALKNMSKVFNKINRKLIFGMFNFSLIHMLFDFCRL